MESLEDLSRDVTEHVAKHLNPVDLIELAFVSSAWDRLIKSFRIHIREVYLSLRGLAYGDEKGVADILLGVRLVQRGFVHFFFYKKTVEELREIQNDPRTSIKYFDGIPMECQVDQSNVKIYTVDPIESFISVMNHVILLFNGPIHHVQLANCCPKTDVVITPLLRRPKFLECTKMTIPNGQRISNHLLRLFLGLPNLQNFHCFAGPISQFTFIKPINIRYFSTCFGEWINRRTLYSLNSESIDLVDPRLSLQDLNAYIKKWLEEEESKIFKRLYIIFCRGWKFEDDEIKGDEKIFEGIEWKKYDEKTSKRPRYYVDKVKGKFDMKNARDIQRSDGTLATVRTESDSFLFVVWKYSE
uniref:F-box domain-containing protein n=1 Tax=Caenorhabditis tropicalis TaxID=1561998 RepID=A0A1I7U460_9PELO